ncbi:MAG: sigma-70 family RNA polymerase sigma factor [Hyphomicrobiaceae bacterium]
MRVETAYDFETCLVESLPRLRAFATALSGNRETAADLVQETVVRALEKAPTFRGDAPIIPWLIVILRNIYYNNLRKYKRETTYDADVFEDRLIFQPEQSVRSELNDVNIAMAKLSAKHREAINLVVFEDLSYIEASEVSGCSIGTIKSRLNRARKLVDELVSPEAISA